MAAIELYTPQGAEMVSGMMYEPYEPYGQGVIMRLEHHLVGGYVCYISPHIIIIIKCSNNSGHDCRIAEDVIVTSGTPQRYPGGLNPVRYMTFIIAWVPL